MFTTRISSQIVQQIEDVAKDHVEETRPALSLHIESLEPRIAPAGVTPLKQVGWGC